MAENLYVLANLFSKFSCNKNICNVLNLKKLEGGGGGGQIDPRSGFSKNAFSDEKMKPCFFVTFNPLVSGIH